MNNFIFLTLWVTSLFYIPTRAQGQDSVKGAIELRAAYSLQRPYFVTSNLSDIALPRQQRYRSALSAELRYYPFNRWFAEYQLGYSQEGGGYANQFTNVNYFKNSILLGYSSKHSHRVIFDLYAGWYLNILLSAKFKNIQEEKIDVGSYFSKTAQGFSLGMGVKTKIKNNYFVGVSTFMNIGLTPVSKNVSPEELQYLLPAFKVSVSRLIR